MIGLLLLAGCLPEYPSVTFPLDPGHDWDGDGIVERQGDCDDEDAARHPGAPEVCNGLDDDCDDLVDDDDDDIDPSTQTEWWFDADGDGYGATDRSSTTCDVPEESWATRVTGDCDDSRAEVHPDAAETCGNGLDDDCDGSPGECGWDATVTTTEAQIALSGSAEDDNFGEFMASAGDLDLDGFDDLLVSAPRWDAPDGAEEAGVLFWISGTDLPQGEANIDDVEAVRFEGAVENGLFGAAAVLVPGEGGSPTSLVVSATAEYPSDVEGGAVYLFTDPTAGGRTSAEADFEMHASNLAELGITLTPHDGGFAAGAVKWEDDGGLVVLVQAPPAGEHEIDLDAEWVTAAIQGADDGDNLGASLDGQGDLDGDGMADLVIGGHFATVEDEEPGAVYVFSGPVRGRLGAEDADWTVWGAADGSRFGGHLHASSDLDGDGRDDLVVGATFTEAPDGGDGAAYVLHGQGGLRPDSAVLAVGGPIIYAGEGDAGLGRRAVTLDFNGDGARDLLLCASTGPTADGTATLFEGPILETSGIVTTDDADLRFTSGGTDVRVGREADTAGDLDHDGFDDLLLGAPASTAGGLEEAGLAYVFFGAEGE